MKTNIKTSAMCALALPVLFVLAGCGGGGGSSGGSSTAIPTPSPISVPNSLIPTTGTGAKDTYFMAGCVTVSECYGTSTQVTNILESTGSVYPNGVSRGFRRIEGARINDPSLNVPNPPRDVRQAWRDGWTGRGVDILIMDSFGTANQPIFSDHGTHGYSVAMSAAETAPHARYSGVNAGTGRTNYLEGDFVVSDATYRTRFDVINMSFGSSTTLSSLPSGTRLAAERRSDPLYRDLRGEGTFSNTRDAVLVKSAGNDGREGPLARRNTQAGYELTNLALLSDRQISPRLLIVGALDKYARTSNPQRQSNISTRAVLADYSNHAGTVFFPDSNGNIRVRMSDRFLVEYGGTPYGESAYLCDAIPGPGQGCDNSQLLDTIGPFRPGIQGTSFAAPRVAGFAALVRDKFPGLSGAQTAKILLDTATYQGLACHPNCRVSIYGQGRVDILDALSPIGKLQ